jgi:phosphate transport system substrate-binding protein
MKYWIAAGGVFLLSLFARPGTPATLLINGAGATFPYPIYSKWFDEYHKLHPEIEINYQAVGSGAGIRQLEEGTVDFGASDMPMTDSMLAQSKVKILHFPTVLGADVPTYNIPGVSAQLRFPPSVLAKLFLGEIKKWNDQELVRANPGVKLPAEDVMIVHRSDASGTTFIWTDYLSKVSPEWKSRVGASTSVQWPTGLGAKGNQGVSGLVQQTPYSLGYVELIYALQNKLSYGEIRNSSGNYITPSLATVTAAAAGALKHMPADFRVSITDPPGPDAYPIASFTYLLIPQNISSAAKRDAIKGFLQWMLAKGESMASSLDYAPLPASLVKQEQQRIGEIH